MVGMSWMKQQQRLDGAIAVENFVLVGCFGLYSDGDYEQACQQNAANREGDNGCFHAMALAAR
jgi:hypothetical protein